MNLIERAKVREVYRSWKEIYGIPQGSILSPIIFNIDLCDLFFIMKDIDTVSYADENTLHVSFYSITNLVEDLEGFARSIF